MFFHDPAVKETWNSVDLAEDGRYLLRYRGMFDKTSIWLEDLRGTGEPVPLTTAMDANYSAQVAGDKLIIHTDWGAPRYRAMITTVDRPGREHWKELIPQSDEVLSYVSAILGVFCKRRTEQNKTLPQNWNGHCTSPRKQLASQQRRRLCGVRST